MTKQTAPLSALLLLLAIPFPARAASDPGPASQTSAASELAAELSGVHLLQLEISWDFGDLGGPDWRKELTEDDPTASFLLRWKHSGPSFESARLTVYDEHDVYRGFLPLPLDPPFADGWRYTRFAIGDLPDHPPVTMRVRLMNAAGNQAGSASPEVQISVPEPDDPFLYTPLFIAGVRTDTGVPGLAGGVTCGAGRLVQERRFFTGVRKFDGGAGLVGPNDRWHWGSITKSMTCTLLATLIDDGMLVPGGGGALTWGTRLSAVWPEWAGQMHPRFIDTTLRHLACHRSGVYLNSAEGNLANTASGNARDLRAQIAFSVTRRQHIHPDTGVASTLGTFHYRNENYFLLGAAIERLANRHYEDLINERLFGPLGMTTCRWGVPPEFSYYQPHGHIRADSYPYGPSVLNKQLYPPQAPAGALYCSIADMLKYLRLHLNGHEGSLALQAATLAELHTPYPQQSPDDARYGWGWGARMDASRVSHNGSIGTYFAFVSVDRSTGIAVAAATNIGAGPEMRRQSVYGDDAVYMLHAHLEEKAKAKEAPTLRREPSPPEATATTMCASGWSPNSAAGRMDLPPTAPFCPGASCRSLSTFTTCEPGSAPPPLAPPASARFTAPTPTAWSFASTASRAPSIGSGTSSTSPPTVGASFRRSSPPKPDGSGDPHPAGTPDFLLPDQRPCSLSATLLHAASSTSRRSTVSFRRVRQAPPALHPRSPCGGVTVLHHRGEDRSRRHARHHEVHLRQWEVD